MSVLLLRHLRLVAICSLCIAGTAAAAVLQDPVATSAKDRVTLCHAEGNGSWHSITVAPEAGLEGHDGHLRDIVPAFTYEKGGEVIEYPGKNLGGDGQAIYDRGCVAPDPPDPPDYPIGVFGEANCEEGRATYSVTFGYDSENKVPVSIPIGPNNFVSPGSWDRSQPTIFQPGRVASAFTVQNIPIEVTSGSWTVTHGRETRTATVTAPSGCGGPPPPIDPAIDVFVSCVDKGNATYTARFGYWNRGSATVSIAVGLANRFSPEPRGAKTTDRIRGGA